MHEPYVRAWTRPGESHRYVSDYLIASAHLAPEQVTVIEISLKTRELNRIRSAIDRLTKRAKSFSTPEGVAAERDRLNRRRAHIRLRISHLQTEEGKHRLIASYEEAISHLERLATGIEQEIRDLERG